MRASRTITLSTLLLIMCAALAASTLLPGTTGQAIGPDSRGPGAAGTTAVSSPIAESTSTPPASSPPPIYSPDSLPPGDYYVSTTGADSAHGSLSDPWLTLQKAANSAPAGSTVYVRAGTYGPFELRRSGLKFTSYKGETATILGTPSVRNAIHIVGVTSAELSFLTVTGNVVQYGAGILVDSSSGVRLAHLVVHDNTSFGIRTNSSSVVVEQSDIYGNHSGIEVARSGTVEIRGNDIHNNDKMIDSGVGAQGVSLYYTTGSVLVTGNRIWSNRALPGDPLGHDGKAFEIYAARNVTMTANVIWDNVKVLESGTDKSESPCSNLVFTKNLAYRSGTDPTMGLILRCADHSLIAANTLVALDKFAFDVSSLHGAYGGSIDGLRILDNLVLNGREYSIDNAIPSTVVLDYNLAYTTPAATAQYGTYYAWAAGHDQTARLAAWQSWTGTALHDVWGLDPMLGNGYCPEPGSPAIDAGIDVGLPYSGSAPDIGYCETG